MSALIGPSASEAQSFCQWVESQSGHKPLQPAGFNTPAQTVISGSLQALKWTAEHIKQYNFSVQKPVRLIPLKVAGGFHSSLFEPAEQKMKEVLKDMSFQNLKIPVVHNTTAKPSRRADEMREALSCQITKPVQWVQSMEYLFKQNCTHFLELGPGKTLAGLMKKTNPAAKVFHCDSLEDIKQLQTRLKNG